MAKQSSHHTSPTTVVVSTAGASAAAASLSTSATTAVTTSSNHLISASNGQPLNQIDHHDMLNASTFDEVPVNGNIDSLISSSSSFIQSSTNHYQEISFIGSGAYGSVYKARNVHSEDLVALKKVRIPVSDDGVPITLIREIALLKQLESFAHPNVVRLLDICHGNRSIQERQFTLYLVFEHVEQDLATYLELCPSPGLSPDRIKDIMYQIMRGVDFLHSNRIVHRDLKPQNILISNSGEVKLADFGLARIYEQMQTLTTVVVTLWYRSPEVLLKSSYASSVDIWSCGCIFAELHTRKPLFPGTSEVDQLSKIFKILGSPPIDQWPADVSLSWKFFADNRKTPFNQVIPEIEDDAQRLLESMLTFDPAKRSSATQILENDYFKDFELYPPTYYSNYSHSLHTTSNGNFMSNDHHMNHQHQQHRLNHHHHRSSNLSNSSAFSSSIDTSNSSTRSVIDPYIQSSSTSSSSSSSSRKFNH